MEQTYTVNLTDGTQQVWTGDIATLSETEPGAVAFLCCPAGTLINVAHIVTMVPVG